MAAVRGETDALSEVKMRLKTQDARLKTQSRQPLHCILPPDLLDRLARASDDVVRNAALDTLRLDQLFRVTRAEMASRLGGPLARPITFGRIGGKPHRTIYDQQHSTTQTPGTVARAEGQAAVAAACGRVVT